jgi:hypothetical protein
MIIPVSDSAYNVIRNASYNKQIVIKNSNILSSNKKIILKPIDKYIYLKIIRKVIELRC